MYLIKTKNCYSPPPLTTTLISGNYQSVLHIYELFKKKNLDPTYNRDHMVFF